MRILNDEQENLLKDERKLLNDLQITLVQFGIAPDDQQTLSQSINQLDELFLLVIVGEFNSGKSAFINALLGQKLLKEGVTPTTTEINILRYGETPNAVASQINQRVVTLPSEMLQEISIVDTPGTNAIIREHEAITSQFVPRSDLVLFITSADRPFTESERAFLERIRDWGKKVVIVINKIDILQNEDDIRQVVDFVAENAHHLLGITPEVFPISARQALRAKQGEPSLWQTSRFEPLETYIRNTLDESSRLRLKLMNPLGIASHLVDRYAAATSARLDLLKSDFDLLNDVDSQLALYKEDMQRDFDFRLSDIEKILFEMETRGDAFFDEMFRLGRIFDLMSKARVQLKFEQEVVGDVPQRIEQRVNELIDWLVSSDLRQWQAVNDHLAERRKQHQDRIVGDTGPGSFQYDRERVIDAVGREAARVVETYDQELEASQIAEAAQLAVAASAAIEVGAIGLGAVITAIATTAAADITGIALAGVVAILGLFVIPARKQQAKTEMHEKITDLRQRLMKSLRAQFAREIERSLNHINEAMAPYTRFVRAEQGSLQEIQARLQALQTELNRVKSLVERI